MERDFMGLNSVKKEVSGDVSDSAAMPVIRKAQGTQWPFTSVPHFSSHSSAQEDIPNKTAPSSLAQNLAGFPVKPSPLNASVARLADSRNKSDGSPAQMTIFYKGTVKVYDSITPEKAQAIMFLAGNASCLVTSDAPSGARVRPPTPKFDTSTTNICLPVSQRVNGQPSSNNGAQSMSSSTSTDELVINKSTLNPSSPGCRMEPPPKPMAALGSAAAPSTIPRGMNYGIPQFRKVSLARFLEKRRERVMNAAPYNSAKKPECTS